MSDCIYIKGRDIKVIIKEIISRIEEEVSAPQKISKNKNDKNLQNMRKRKNIIQFSDWCEQTDKKYLC